MLNNGEACIRDYSMASSEAIYGTKTKNRTVVQHVY